MEEQLHPTIAEYQTGKVLLVDKPLEWTSFDAVNCIRAVLRHKLNFKKIKVGHAGTLDPLATGLLIICSGKATKQIDSYQAKEKEYTGTLLFGASTPSYDAETEIDATYDVSELKEEKILEKLKLFTGEIEQTPPLFSAVKVNGVKACDAARKRQEIKMRPRQVTVFTFEITKFRLPEVDFRIVCSKGTYIRSLVHDLGKALDNGAYLTALRRTRIGQFTLEGSKTPQEWRELIVQQSIAFPQEQSQ